MAKKQEKHSHTAAAKPKAGKQGKDASGKILKMAEQMVKYAHGGVDPYLEIPIRSLTNVSFDPKRRIIEMGVHAEEANIMDAIPHDRIHDLTVDEALRLNLLTERR